MKVEKRNFELHITLRNGTTLHFGFACQRLESAQKVARYVLNDNYLTDLKLVCVDYEHHYFDSLPATVEAANEMITFWSKVTEV